MGVDHNPYVAKPRDQVSGSRLMHAPEPAYSAIELVGWGIRVRQSGASVKVVHQMRTIHVRLGWLFCMARQQIGKRQIRGLGKCELLRRSPARNGSHKKCHRQTDFPCSSHEDSHVYWFLDEDGVKNFDARPGREVECHRELNET